MVDILDIAKFFLAKEAMTPKKLQKILYYAYSWFLTLENDPEVGLENRLFENNFQAWVHGPVDPEIYAEYKGYGYSLIPRKNSENLDLSEQILKRLDQVWDIYGEFDADELENLTHQESPWINARGDSKPLDICRTPISDADIYDCYAERLMQ